VEKDRVRERVFRGFVRQRAPAAFQAGLTPRPSGSLVGALSFASPSRLAFPSSLQLRERPLCLLTARAASALKSAVASAVANSSSTSRPRRELVRVRKRGWKGVHARRLRGETAPSTWKQRQDQNSRSADLFPFPFSGRSNRRSDGCGAQTEADDCGDRDELSELDRVFRNIIRGVYQTSVRVLLPELASRMIKGSGDLHFLRGDLIECQRQLTAIRE